MLWTEKLLLLILLALAVYPLYLSFVFVPVLDNQALVGPVFLPPCGFRLSTGVPCPTCYMTRSFVLMAHGHAWQAVLLQPFGALLFGLLALSVPALGVALFRRRSVWPLLEGRPWRRIFLIFFLLALAAWGYTVVRDLTVGPP